MAGSRPGQDPAQLLRALPARHRHQGRQALLQNHGVDAPAPPGPLQQADEPRLAADQGRAVELRERFRDNALGLAPQARGPGARARGRRTGAPVDQDHLRQRRRHRVRARRQDPEHVRQFGGGGRVGPPQGLQDGPLGPPLLAGEHLQGQGGQLGARQGLAVGPARQERVDGELDDGSARPGQCGEQAGAFGPQVLRQSQEPEPDEGPPLRAGAVAALEDAQEGPQERDVVQTAPGAHARQGAGGGLGVAARIGGGDRRERAGGGAGGQEALGPPRGVDVLGLQPHPARPVLAVLRQGQVVGRQQGVEHGGEGLDPPVAPGQQVRGEPLAPLRPAGDERGRHGVEGLAVARQLRAGEQVQDGGDLGGRGLQGGHEHRQVDLGGADAGPPAERAQEVLEGVQHAGALPRRAGRQLAGQLLGAGGVQDEGEKILLIRRRRRGGHELPSGRGAGPGAGSGGGPASSSGGAPMKDLMERC